MSNLREAKFKPGDRVKYVGNFKPHEGEWEVVEEIGFQHVESSWKCKLPSGDFADISGCFLELVEHCVCDIRVLITTGCVCGQMAREKGL